jgi:predicted metalloprotease
MRWRGGQRGGGIEDRRGLSGGGLAAGGGIGAVVIGLIGYFVLGINPQTTQQILGQFGGLGSGQERGTEGTPADDAGLFVDVVGRNVNDVWAANLPSYTPPKVVLYEQGTGTGCGFGQAAMGPFYCPTDQTVYLDLSFWDQMGQLGASKADFAKAYVIAHEFGHHVQTLTGASQKVQQAQQSMGQEQGNKYSVALELQADCYAGVWASNATKVSNGEVSAEAGDLEEGLRTAKAIGDDALMGRSGGRVVPENFTHGSSEQRMQWLQSGFRSGDPRVCEGTFDGL